MATTDPIDFYRRKLKLLEAAIPHIKNACNAISAITTCERHDAACPDEELLKEFDSYYADGEDESVLFKIFDHLMGERAAVKEMVEMHDYCGDDNL